MECAQNNPFSDPKCLLLHQSWLLCAGKEVAPRLYNTYMTCTSRNKNSLELCENDFQNLWSGVIGELQKSERVVKVDLMSELEEEVLLDCKPYKEAADKLMNESTPESTEALEKWMKCCIPKICADSYQTYAKCLNSNSGNIDNCIEEGRPLVKCLSDFTIRYARSVQ